MRIAVVCLAVPFFGYLGLEIGSYSRKHKSEYPKNTTLNPLQGRDMAGLGFWGLGLGCSIWVYRV